MIVFECQNKHKHPWMMSNVDTQAERVTLSMNSPSVYICQFYGCVLVPRFLLVFSFKDCYYLIELVDHRII